MRPLGRLKDIQVKTAGVGVYGDGGGLVLCVRQGATGLNRVWMFRYKRDGRAHWMGLGAYPDVTLASAREKAQDARAGFRETRPAGYAAARTGKANRADL